MATTPPQPPPTTPGPPPAGPPPSAPPPGPPSGPPPTPPGAAPPKSGGTNVWLITTIVISVLAVIFLVFGIFSFVGKSSADDDKDKAQKELASTKAELGTSKGAGQILGDLVSTGAKSADDLKACTDSARTVQNQAIDVLNQKQAGTDVNPQIDALNSAIDQNTSLCNTSQQSYQAFVDALNKLQNK
jgi:hypothetical protein